MTLNMIKDIVKNNLNKNNVFKYNGARNHIEIFEGRITEVYPAVFIITLNDKKIRSFTYADLLVNNLEIMK